MNKKYKRLLTVIAILVVVGGIYYTIRTVQSADYTFIQTDWSGGQSGDVAVHETNRVGWTKYSTKNGNLISGSELSSADVSAIIEKTSDLDFSSGAFSGVAIYGSGTDANLQLQQEISIDGGTGSDGSYACTTGTCVLTANTYNYTTFDISAGAIVKVIGSNALVIKATGDVTIDGVLDLAGGNEVYACGQFWCGGGGGGGNGGTYNRAGGASLTGGGAGGAIKQGGKSAGGGGGGGTTSGSLGGGGGGTVYINSNQNIVISNTGTLTAKGGSSNGGVFGKMGGNGAGGKIVLTSATITNNGLIDATSPNNGYPQGEFGIITLIYNAFSGTIPSGSTSPGLSTAYPSVGTYVSDVLDTNQNPQFTELAYNTTLNGQAITIDVRAGNTIMPDETWTVWQTNIVNGGDISAFSGNRYIQYRVNFSTTDTVVTPILHDITFNYHYIPSIQELTSNIFNTQSNRITVTDLQWTEVFSQNTDIAFQIRTSPNGVSWSNWCGPDDGVSGLCNSITYFTDPMGGEMIDDTQRDQSNDQYVQYKVSLSSMDGQNTPILSDVSISYAAIDMPGATTQQVTDISQDQVTAHATVISTGNENPTRAIQYTTTSNNYTGAQECSAGTGSIGAYSCQITNLTSNTTYYVRAKATNSAGTIYGDELSFTTLQEEIIIQDPDTDKISDAVTDGYITIDNGSITDTAQATTTVNVTVQDGTFQMELPQNTQITGDGSFNFQQFTAQNVTQAVRDEQPTSRVAIDVGVPGESLNFSEDITLQIYVGTAFNTMEMAILYQNDGDPTWYTHTTPTC
ncbi:MAG: hypothetical protein WC819_06190, partial [Parcubacteria group bacterium]